MTVDYDEAAREAMASASDGGLFFTPLEITHPTLTDPVRVVANSPEDLRFRLETDAPYNAGEEVWFTACPYNVRLPAHGLLPDPYAVLTIDATPADLLQAAFNLANSSSPAQVIVREYLDKDKNEPKAVLRMYMTNITASLQQMSAQLRILNAANVPFPPNIITREDFASLGA